MKLYEVVIEQSLFNYWSEQPDTLRIARQLRIPSSGIADLVVVQAGHEGEPDITHIIECKAVKAGPRTLEQLNRYLRGMTAWYEANGVDDAVLAGWIVAPSFHRDLIRYEAEAELRGEMFRLYQFIYGLEAVA